jgi:hypothetical protein
MSTVLRRSALVPACVALAATLWSAYSSPGTPVSDELAAELRGGCPGWKSADCTGTVICSNNGYISAGKDDQSEGPSGAGTTYCTKTHNQQIVCNDSSQSYSSCGS